MIELINLILILLQKEGRSATISWSELVSQCCQLHLLWASSQPSWLHWPVIKRNTPVINSEQYNSFFSFQLSQWRDLALEWSFWSSLLAKYSPDLYPQLCQFNTLLPRHLLHIPWFMRESRHQLFLIPIPFGLKRIGRMIGSEWVDSCAFFVNN